MMPPAREPALTRAARHQPGLSLAVGPNPHDGLVGWRVAGACMCATVLPAAIWLLPQTLSRDGRIALIVLVLAVIGWTMTRGGDTLIGLAAASALAATGTLDMAKLFGMLGHELIWLLVATFVISAVLRASGLLELVVFAMLRRFHTVRSQFLILTGVIAATAFVIPSTSGRAALMLPVFLTLTERIGNERIVRALALLFPSIILLSAGGSLIGAGAHIVAVDFIAKVGNEPIDYFGWAALTLPFALLSCFIAAATILRLFLTSEEASARVQIASVHRGRPTRQQFAIAAIVLVIIGLWMTVPLHGLSLVLIALTGAIALLMPGVATLTPGAAFKTVDTELIVFMATTLAVAAALSESGADRWLTEGVILAVPAFISRSTPAIVALVALVSLLAHVVIISRTARVAVLIPALALPLAGLGHDPKLLILVTVMGTGFCQTLPASAKPLALFAITERPTYTSGDLVRLSAALLPAMFALLMLFALTVWS